MFTGLLDLPWWGYVLATLGLTHITIAAVTIYLHRHQAHRALELHALPSHFFRFWLWIATGMQNKLAPELVQKLNAAVQKALASDMRERLQADGIVPGGGGTPLATALQLACVQAQSLQRNGVTPLLVVLSDGRANVTLTPGNVEIITDDDGRFMIDYLRDTANIKIYYHGQPGAE